MANQKVKKEFKYRKIGLPIFLICSILLSILVDPSDKIIQNLPFGAGTLSFIVTFLMYTNVSVLGVALLHYCLKISFDYVNLFELYKKAKEEPMASAVFACAYVGYGIALAIIISAFVQS